MRAAVIRSAAYDRCHRNTSVTLGGRALAPHFNGGGSTRPSARRSRRYDAFRVATLIPASTRVVAAGNKPKSIDEYVGRLNSGTDGLSIAHMHSPGGWAEPAQTPDFDEYTLVLSGRLRVVSASGELDVNAGQAVIAAAGEWVQYSTPDSEGAEYIAVCVPAFSPKSVHREGT